MLAEKYFKEPLDPFGADKNNSFLSVPCGFVCVDPKVKTPGNTQLNKTCQPTDDANACMEACIHEAKMSLCD